ncbi:MAG: DUF4173 domain-containing protein [Candidatus Gracilibacteria bacterium]|nr:DUF4173 domain-containing protein [Candidatus Gracilibacteria bacterium]
MKKVNITKRYDLIFAISLALVISFWFSIFTNLFFTLSFLLILLLLNLFIVFNILEKKFLIFGKISDYIYNFINIFFTSINRIGFSTGKIIESFVDERGITKINKTTLKNFGFGFGILLILLLIIIPLLSSADKVFKSFVDEFLIFFYSNTILNNFIESFNFFNIIFIILLFLIFFSLFLYISTYKVKISEKKEKEYKTINSTIVNIVIYGLNILYFLFILIQFKYIFFGNQELFTGLDITYASYIHQGFYQLIIVSAINYFLYKFFYNRVQKNNSMEKIKFFFLLLFTIIISYSALTRIFLYIDAL